MRDIAVFGGRRGRLRWSGSRRPCRNPLCRMGNARSSLLVRPCGTRGYGDPCREFLILVYAARPLAGKRGREADGLLRSSANFTYGLAREVSTCRLTDKIRHKMWLVKRIWRKTCPNFLWGKGLWRFVPVRNMLKRLVTFC